MIFRILSTILVAAAVGMAADWPMFRGNEQRTGCTPENTGYPSDAPVWQTKLGGSIISSPSIVAGIVYVGCRDSCLYAIDSQRGTILWKFCTRERVDASPLVANGKVYAASRDGNVYILNAGTGDSVGVFATHGLLMSSPVLYTDQLIIGVGNPDARITVFRLGADTAAWSFYLPQYTYSSPAIAGSIAIIGVGGGGISAYSLISKNQVWSKSTTGEVYLSSPAVAESLVYFAPGEGDWNVYCLRLSNGALVWASSGNSSLAKRTAVDPSLIQSLRLLTPESRIARLAQLLQKGIIPSAGFALAKRSASTVSGFIPVTGMIKTSSVAVDGSRVYVVQREDGNSADIDMAPLSRFTLFVLDRTTGAMKWKYSEITSALELGYNSSPIVAGKRVFAAWGDGHIMAFDALTGEKGWADTVESGFLSSPAVSNGNLFAATTAGWLYSWALGASPQGSDFNKSTYCFPNPATGDVSYVQVYVDRQADMTMTIYSMGNRPVAFVSKALAAGEKYQYDWNLASVANGVYFARIKVKYGDGKEDKKTVKIAVLR